MFIAFALESVGILALYMYGQNPVAFVLLTGLVLFARGKIYSLFPSTCADTFGSKNAAANAGLLYTAKGTASLLAPFPVFSPQPLAGGMLCSSSPASVACFERHPSRCAAFCALSLHRKAADHQGTDTVRCAPGKMFSHRCQRGGLG